MLASNRPPAVRKAVIPAAGFGTRFLPFTRAVPKEMIPLVDKPVIQYVVEEAAKAGITDILIITSAGKEAMHDHFTAEPGLEARLAATGKTALLEELHRIQHLAELHYVTQTELNGLGGALLLAEEFVAGEPFAVLLGDTVVESSTDEVPIAQLIRSHEQTNGAVVALEQVPRERVSQYGVVAGTPELDPRLIRIEALVEKPRPEAAPSNLVIASRYVLKPAIFDCLRQSPPHGAGRELYLTDAIMKLGEREAIYGYEILGHRYDIGNKLEFLKATVEFGLRHPDGGAKFLEYLKQRLS
ncbi:UTP--glucose-1-phosphate uridylyltransferase [bioreactor metagenome]|uniref:UTP--glucose-1-phosphate uridylyltransferase n=1 Tax=bioreactor metagenome TaxID=1076179 RepID=A0A644YCN7_9ZZZZ